MYVTGETNMHYMVFVYAKNGSGERVFFRVNKMDLDDYVSDVDGNETSSGEGEDSESE